MSVTPSSVIKSFIYNLNKEMLTKHGVIINSLEDVVSIYYTHKDELIEEVSNEAPDKDKFIQQSASRNPSKLCLIIEGAEKCFKDELLQKIEELFHLNK